MAVGSPLDKLRLHFFCVRESAICRAPRTACVKSFRSGEWERSRSSRRATRRSSGSSRSWRSVDVERRGSRLLPPTTALSARQLPLAQ